MPGSLDSCINSIYEPGNIPASAGTPPVRVLVAYDPEEVENSLDYSKYYNNMYLLLLMV